MPPEKTTSVRPLRADAQRNRRRVLDAAEALFGDTGNGATIEDIAKRAGVGVGTVCRHFPTKQALLDEVLTESYRELVADAEQALSSQEPAAAFEQFVHRLAAHQARRRVLAEQMATELALPEAAEELRVAMRRHIAELVERAQAAGAVRSDISPADTLDALRRRGPDHRGGGGRRRSARPLRGRDDGRPPARCRQPPAGRPPAVPRPRSAPRREAAALTAGPGRAPPPTA